MLFTKCILDSIDANDGLRISIMSRHTLNDGFTPDVRIIPDLYDLHLSLFSPSPFLVGGYLKNKISWEEYAAQYLDFLRSKKLAAVRLLTLLAIRKNVTIMCIEQDHERCHRRLLAEFCQNVNQDLKIEHH